MEANMFRIFIKGYKKYCNWFLLGLDEKTKLESIWRKLESTGDELEDDDKGYGVIVEGLNANLVIKESIDTNCIEHIYKPSPTEVDFDEVKMIKDIKGLSLQDLSKLFDIDVWYSGLDENGEHELYHFVNGEDKGKIGCPGALVYDAKWDD